ncbi:hypothetical protein Tco_0428023 [Tanacetum coccineum]
MLLTNHGFATNQKFNFSKYIFESMVKNLENVSGKFLMYQRFVQVFLDKQLEGMPSHKRIYVTPYHTKKIFRNIRRVGKGFYGRETPLFQMMMVQDQEEVGEGLEMPTDPITHPPLCSQPLHLLLKETKIMVRSKRKDTKAFVSSNNSSSTNEAVNTAHEVFAASTQANAANPINVDNLSDVMAMLKTLEVALKRKTKRVLLSDSEEEETENSDNSYLRDILGDILGKDMHYPFTLTTAGRINAIKDEIKDISEKR